MHVDNMKVIITLYKRWRDVKIPSALSMRLRKIIAKEMSVASPSSKRLSKRQTRRKK